MSGEMKMQTCGGINDSFKQFRDDMLNKSSIRCQFELREKMHNMICEEKTRGRMTFNYKDLLFFIGDLYVEATLGDCNHLRSPNAKSKLHRLIDDFDQNMLFLAYNFTHIWTTKQKRYYILHMYMFFELENDDELVYKFIM